MRRKRRNHLPAFKAKVALSAIQGNHALAKLSEKTATQIRFGIRRSNYLIRLRPYFVAAKTKSLPMNPI